MNKYYVGTILWSGLILALTLTPGKSLPSVGLFTYDKLGHSVIFMVLTFLYTSGLYTNKNSLFKSIIIGFTLTVTYGMAIEIAQEYIPDRAMDWKDLVANCSGSALGIAFFSLFNHRKGN